MERFQSFQNNGSEQICPPLLQPYKAGQALKKQRTPVLYAQGLFYYLFSRLFSPPFAGIKNAGFLKSGAFIPNVTIFRIFTIYLAI